MRIITIVVFEDGLDCHWEGEITPDDYLYALGIDPPNHLPPAIRYELRVEPNFFGHGAVVFVRHEEGRMWLEECIYATEEKKL